MMLQQLRTQFKLLGRLLSTLEDTQFMNDMGKNMNMYAPWSLR